MAYIGLPKVDKREQHRLAFTPKEISFLVTSAQRSDCRVLFALLAGTGLRIGEMLALEKGKHILADCAVLSVRQQRDRWGSIQSTPKTEASFPDVDLHPKLAEMLRSHIATREVGFLFKSTTGTMLWPGPYTAMA